jgi:hypothetical protein
MTLFVFSLSFLSSNSGYYCEPNIIVLLLITYLYFFFFSDQIRFLQRSQTHFIPRLRHTDDIDGLRRSLRRNEDGDEDEAGDLEEDPTMCTHSTHR